MNTFGNELRKLRTERGMTQVELAAALDISRSAVGMYEHGERQPEFELLEKIADFFQVDMNTVFGKTDTELYTEVYMTRELANYFNVMNDEQKERLLHYARYLIQNKE